MLKIKRLIHLAIVVLLLATVSTWALGPEQLGNEQLVTVVNLETPHPVEGQVSVFGTIEHSDVVRVNDTIVPSAAREETARWVEAGMAQTSGFTSLVLSLHGQVRGNVSVPGFIGVILIPDEESILQALTEGEILLPLETQADVVAGSTSYFSASNPYLAIAFPRYRIFLYNTTDQSAAANVCVYLMN
jgi:hypothetical protein